MATVLLAPSVRAAFAHAAASIGAAKQADPAARAEALLPTAEAVWRLSSEIGSSIAIHLHQFYGLGQTVLVRARRPVHRLSNVAVHRLVRHLIEAMQAEGRLPTFARVCDKPGFTRVLVDWLREVKAQGITPEQMEAEADRTGSPRDGQLAGLYRRYQSFLLDRHLVDGEGVLWLAAGALAADPSLCRGDHPFVVLGFDQFNPTQLRILAHLADRLPGLAIYLVWDGARPRHSLALTRLSHTLDDLEQALRPRVRHLDADERQPPVLRRLRDTLFEMGAPPIDAAVAGSLRAVAAPSREAEVRLALRRVKQLLLQGVGPERIAVLAAHPGTYRPLVRVVAAEYGLPVSQEQRLVEVPPVAAFVALLGLAPHFPWRATFDALRSPYVGQPRLTPEDVGLLDTLTRQRPVVVGREQWLHALRPAPPAAERDDDELAPPPLAATLAAEELARLQEGLVAFFDHVTPPARGSRRSYAAWVQERLLGAPAAGDGSEAPDDRPAALGEAEQGTPGLAGIGTPGLAGQGTAGLAGCCRDGAHAERDLQALAQVDDALRQLAQTSDLLPEPEAGIVWEAYRSEVLALLQGIAFRPRSWQRMVRFDRLDSARALDCDHLFVLGLSEGEFPRPPEPDVLYGPGEREASPLPLQRRHPAEDASLWWQVVGSACRELVLLRPRFDENGAPWPPSAYWHEVVDRVADPGWTVEEPPVGATPAPEEAAGTAELLVALARRHARAVPPALRPAWQTALAADGVARERLSWRPPARYEGIVQAPDLLAQLEHRFGPDRSWSASRLSRHAACPFSFFASAVLGLEPLADPVVGIDALQRGRLLHAVLESLYRELTALRLCPSGTCLDQVLGCLDVACDAAFARAPERYRFRPGALWRHEQSELLRQLRVMLAWEAERNDGDGARYLPLRQEVRFGLGDGLPHLRLHCDDGACLEVHGVIDRIDADGSGRLRVVDYKSGATTYGATAVAEGLALQTAFYALAAEQLLPDAGSVAESYYLHIPSRKTSGHLRLAGSVAEDAIVRQAVARAAQAAAQARGGHFPCLPQGSACTSCDFRDLCRVDRHATAKARRMLPA